MSDSILAALLRHAEATPAQPCLRFAGRIYTYADVAGLAAGWAGLLREHGVGPGERVGLYLASSPTFVAAYLGAHMAGAAVVLMNPLYRQAELSHILADSAPRAVVADPESLAELGRAAAGLPAPVALLPSDGAPPPADHGPFAAPAPDDLALLAYTSGTTGRAKGAMLLHRNLAANSAAVTQAWRWVADDLLLLTLPLFHIHGLGVGVNGTLLAGGSLDLRPRFEAAEVLAAIEAGDVTLFFGVPTMYGRLIAEARARGGVAPHHVRLFVSGSAPLAPATFAEFEAIFGQRILERYGMTETVMNTTNPYDGERRPGTVGKPFPGQEARVVDVRGRHELPDGETGEIQVRGPHVFAGYWRNPAATAEAVDGAGWFSTGDLGHRSADGYLTISGRARELIITGGYNVYPREVEEAIARHPEVAEAAVFGLPDPDLGEQVAAAVVPQPGAELTAADLAEFCREQIAGYKKPRRVFFVESLPRNALGKVQKHLLREQLLAEPA